MHIAAAHSTLPQLGDGQEMSLGAERKLGLNIAREIYRDPDYLDDPVLTDYAQRIWQPLLAAARKRGDITSEQASQLAWELMLARDRTVNAFALPGGYFGLHLGLFALVTSRDELASVLAHEITHVTQRHIARQFSQQSQQTPWVIAAAVLGMIAAGKNPQAGQALMVGSQAVGMQAQLNFSRDMEREADRIGYGLAQDAGFDVRGFVSMFDKLQGAARINDSGNFPYLRSHPLTTERLGDMQSRLQLDNFDALPRVPIGVQLEHALMAERARLLADPKPELLRAAQEQGQRIKSTSLQMAQTPAQSIKACAQLYGAAVASWKLGQAAQALQWALTARESLPGLINFMSFEAPSGLEPAGAAIDLIVIDAANLPSAALAAQLPGQTVAALLRLNQMSSQPQRRAWLLARAQLALSAAYQSERASLMDELQTRLAAAPSDALAWQALSQLQEAQGLHARSLRSAAEARAAQLDYSGALDRLKTAQEAARQGGADHVQSSIIDTRTRQVQALMREQHAQNNASRTGGTSSGR